MNNVHPIIKGNMYVTDYKIYKNSPHRVVILKSSSWMRAILNQVQLKYNFSINGI